MSDTGPAATGPVLLVAGFLGAGKTTIVRALTGEDPAAEAAAPPFRDRIAGPCVGADLAVVEASPFLVPGAGTPGQVVVTTVDAVNATGNLADRELGELVAGQIRAADLVVLTCGDVAEPGPARRAIAALTDAPIVEAHVEADLTTAILDRATPGAGPDRAPVDHRAAFIVWTYSGSAVLTKDAMTAFLMRRPTGAYRVRGAIRLGDEGGRVDVFGQARRTSVIECPPITWMTIAGLASRLSVREIELAFAETVTDAAYGRGVIACR